MTFQANNLPHSTAVGLAQVRAHKALQQQARHSLARFDLRATEWLLLGIVRSHKNGIRPHAIATHLGVSAPMVTRLVDGLEARQLIRQTADASDRRASLLALTATGTAFVKRVERTLRGDYAALLHGVSARELQAYHRVLETIVKNASRQRE